MVNKMKGARVTYWAYVQGTCAMMKTNQKASSIDAGSLRPLDLSLVWEAFLLAFRDDVS